MQQLFSQHTIPGIAPRRVRTRDGFLLVELLIALILLTVVASVLPVALKAVYNQRQQERFERTAQLELSNAATQLRQQDEQMPGADAYQLSEWFRRLYPAAEVQVTVADVSPEEPQMVAITLTIRHPWGESRPPLQQSLTTWLFRQEDAP